MPHSTFDVPARAHGQRRHRPGRALRGRGSFQSFTLACTAGYFGIDDTGSIKIVHRTAVKMERRVALRKGADNALHVKIVQEDGHQIWSSPIYVFDVGTS